MTLIKKAILLISFLFPLIANAQNSLSLDSAISMAINKNFDIQIANNSARIANNKVTRGNAGQLPTVGFSASSQYVNYSGNEVGGDNTQMQTLAFSSGVQLDYTLFNGGNKHRYRLLCEQKIEANILNKQTVEDVILQVVIAYYTAASAYELKETQFSLVKLSNQRLSRLQVENSFGTNSSIDVLNAQVDFNNDSIMLMNMAYDYQEKKLNLIELISDKWISDVFEINPSIINYSTFDLDSIINNSLNSNSSVLLLNNRVVQSEINTTIQKSSFLPTIALNTAYNHNTTNSLSYSGVGNNGTFTGGITLTYPIFQGGVRKTELKNSYIELENQRLESHKNDFSVEKEVRLIYSSYINSLSNIKAEINNLEATERNLNLSIEYYNLGQITSTQFREAQQNLLTAKTNLIVAKYSAKIVEYQIFRIAGELLD